jgi:exopolysaccharide biosynthesis polyprenyl glycosylphosphotransferase
MTTVENATVAAFEIPVARYRVARPVLDAAHWTRRYRWRLLVTDTLLIAAALALGSAVVSFGHPLALVFGAGLGVMWAIALEGYRTRDARVVGNGSSEYKRIGASTLLTFGLGAITALVIGVEDARIYYFVTLPIGLAALVTSRWLWRKWLIGRRAEGQYLSRTLVMGGLDDVERVVQHIERSSGAAYSVVGVVLDDSDATVVSTASRNIPALAGTESVASIVRVLEADTVIVAGQRSGDQQSTRELSWALENAPADLVIAPGLADVAGPRIHIRPVDGLPLMHVDLPHFAGGKHILKRAFDIAVAAIALVILAPVLGILALLVKSDGPGPALFKQERIGKNGEPFRMLKFRSMVVTAEDDLEGLLDQNEGAGALFKMRDDPRVTRIGRILRKYSLDELPQIWNILVGDMSLVGPRPPLRREVDEYERHVHRRLYIKPGLTGLWQVSGRSDLSWDESVRLDLFYVENWSLTGDLMIIWRTARMMLNPTGAY